MPTSVRVEVGEVLDGAHAPPGLVDDQIGATGPKSRGLVIGVVVAAFAVIGLILFNLAPEAGRSADGSPIAPTTSQAPTTTSSPSTTVAAEDADPLDQFETVDQDTFLFQVIEADLGWLALGSAQNTDELSILRSLDGLNWVEVDVGLSDMGTIVGIANISGTNVFAVDSKNSWRDRRAVASDGFNVQFFESNDLQTWEESDRLEAINGDGFLGPVQITESTAMALVQRDGTDDETSEQALISYFDSVLEPDEAIEVCAVGARAAEDGESDGGDISVLRTCTGEVIAEVTPESAPSLFANDTFPAMCVNVLREGTFSITAELSSVTNGRTSRSVPSGFSPFGSMIDDVFLTTPFSPDFGFDDSFERCASGDADSVATNSVLRWTVEGSSVVSLPEAPTESDNFQNVLIETSSGDALVVGESGVMRSSPPFLEWDLSPFPDTLDLGRVRWTPSPDGNVILGRGLESLTFVDKDGAILRHIESGIENFFFAVPLLATDEFAIITVDSPRSTSLLKVPFDE